MGRILSLLLVSSILTANVDAQDVGGEFIDIWTRELRESTRNCINRLPNMIEGEDLKFAWTLTSGAYVKYMDQIYFFRIVDHILKKQGAENRPLSEIRCLFESPCMISREYPLGPSMIDVCTGDGVEFESHLQPNGLFEGVIRMTANETAPLLVTGLPAFTDRKSFLVGIRCTSDGSLGFVVLSNRPALSAYSRHLIMDYLRKSGFQDNFRITTTFMSSSCKNRI